MWYAVEIRSDLFLHGVLLLQRIQEGLLEYILQMGFHIHIHIMNGEPDIDNPLLAALACQGDDIVQEFFSTAARNRLN